MCPEIPAGHLHGLLRPSCLPFQLLPQLDAALALALRRLELLLALLRTLLVLLLVLPVLPVLVLPRLEPDLLTPSCRAKSRDIPMTEKLTALLLCTE